MKFAILGPGKIARSMATAVSGLDQVKKYAVGARDLERAQAFAKELADKKVELKIKAGKDGRSFGSVSTKEIAAAAKSQIDLELDKKKMQLNDPIKALGTYEIPVKLHQKVTTKLTVQVVEG